MGMCSGEFPCLLRPGAFLGLWFHKLLSWPDRLLSIKAESLFFFLLWAVWFCSLPCARWATHAGLHRGLFKLTNQAEKDPFTKSGRWSGSTRRRSQQISRAGVRQAVVMCSGIKGGGEQDLPAVPGSSELRWDCLRYKTAFLDRSHRGTDHSWLCLIWGLAAT